MVPTVENQWEREGNVTNHPILCQTVKCSRVRDCRLAKELVDGRLSTIQAFGANDPPFFGEKDNMFLLGHISSLKIENATSR